MSYEAGEAFLLTKAAAATGFTAANTSRSDWKPLNSGASAHYAVLRPGSFEVEWRTFGGEYVLKYTTIVEVWQRYADDGTTQTSLFGNMAAMIAELAKWRTFGGIAEVVVITAGGEPRRMQSDSGGPAYLMQELTVSWAEEATVTYSE